MKLYYSPAACSLSPHIAAREAGLPLDLVKVNLDTHRTADGADFYAINPKGYVLAGNDSAAAVVTAVAGLLKAQGITSVQRVKESPAADITPLAEAGVPAMEIDVDGSRYFSYHHSDGDTLDKLDPAEMARCVAALAVMAYVVADLPEPLPRGRPGA